MIYSMIQDREGRLWLGMTEGICRYDGEAFAVLEIPFDGQEDLWGPGLNAKQVLCLLEELSGAIWLGTWGAGAFRYADGEFESVLADQGQTQKDGQKKNVIQDTIETADGGLWFASMTHGGLSRCDGDSFEHFGTAQGLISDMVPCLLERPDGALWLGSLGNVKGSGLQLFEGMPSTVCGETDGLCNSNVWDLCSDRDGLLWIASHRGELYTFDGETFSTFRSSQGESFEGIQFVVEAPNGDIWFGGQKAQLYRYDGEQVNEMSELLLSS